MAPSFVVNILPHVEAWQASGALASGPAGTAIFQTASVIAMAALPFAIRKTRNVAAPLALTILVGLLLLLNFFNALDLASHVRESATGVARGALQKAAELNARVAELENSRRQVPPFTFTSAAMVQAQQEAVTAANMARDAECKKVGDRCRQRQDEASAAAAKLGEVAAQRELTERAEELDAKIAEAKGELSRLGPVPKYADATAAKLVRVLSLVITVGKGADDVISEWRPILFAIGIELLALIGPFGMFAAFSAGAGEQRPAPAKETFRPDEAAPLPALLPKPAKTAAKTPAKASVKAPKKAEQQEGDPCIAAVQEWLDARTAARPNNLVGASECYGNYKSWCEEIGRVAVSVTKFGTVMKGDLKMPFVEKSRRVSYSGIALKGAALRVVS